ncbi:MAG: flagellar biosynthetic protein FliO [Steroidobacterales bacterium]
MNATARRLAARRAALSLGLSTAIGGANHMLHAAATTPFAAPVQQVAPSPAGGLLRVILALLVVLAAVLAAAWLARRMRSFSGGGGSSLQLLAQLPLGARERAVLLRVGDCRLLIGVAPGNVRTLHVFEESASALDVASTPESGAAPASEGANRPTFKSLLLKSLGK